jgi:hypothetical protein
MRAIERSIARAYASTNRLDLPPRALEAVARGLEDEQNHRAEIENHIDRVAADEQHIEVPQSHRY